MIMDYKFTYDPNEEFFNNLENENIIKDVGKNSEDYSKSNHYIINKLR